MKKQIAIFLLFTIFSVFVFAKISEARVLPQAAKAGKSSSFKTSKSSGINVSPKIRKDRKAVIVYFSNLQNASVVSYVLTYGQNDQAEGALGSLTIGNSDTASQELLFGTCSKNVCRYHTNIKNVKLEVTYTLKSGKKYIKRFRIKV